MAFQVGNTRGARGEKTAAEQESRWREALISRLGDGGGRPTPSWFFEEREDATVELDSGGDGPRVERSRSSGIAAENADGQEVFRADPDPDDASGIGRALSGGDGSVEGSGGARARPTAPVWLPVARGLALVEQAFALAARALPFAWLRARWIAAEQRVLCASEERGVTADRRRAERLRIEARLGRGARTSRAVAETTLETRADECLSRVLAGLSDRLSERAQARLVQGTLRSGRWPIVFAPGVGGILVHEVVGHALEADAVLAGTSWLAEGGSASGDAPRLARSVTVLDDPRRGRAAWRLDDEGHPAGVTTLVRDGRVCGLLHDRRTALHTAEPRTGHGRRASYREPVRPRMGCTFLAAGPAAPDEVLAGIDTGIYVRRMEVGSTDTRTGRTVLRVTDGDLIQDGRLATALAPHLLVVDGRTALSGVTVVGCDLEFDTCIGSCVHHGQPLATSVGGPTFRIGSTLVVFHETAR